MQASYLSSALAQAKIKRGSCAPNPAVGAVIVADQQIIAQGYHAGPGHPHAEIMALQSLQQLPAGATLYVTLEPCCHQGRTPPCTDAILRSGIKRVVYAYEDPNPRVKGKGAAQLRAAGLTVEYISHADISAFYESYAYWHQAQLPWITAKIAQSLNGKIAGPAGERLFLTGPALEKLTHTLRRQSDALLTTAATIIADDPQLNARDETGVHAKPIYVVDRHLGTPLNARVFKTAATLTFFYEAKVASQRIALFQNQGAHCIPLTRAASGINLQEMLQLLGAAGHHDVWLESGGNFMTAMWQEKLINRFYLYLAPRWIMEGKPAFTADISFAGKHISMHQCEEEFYLKLQSFS